MDLEAELRELIDGDVHFDTIHRRVYSVDASIYEIEPVGIVVPKNKKDLINAVKIAYRHRVPVIARGAATGITGGCIGQGLVIDTSKYLDRVLEYNYSDEYAVCEPGVVQDRLNEALADWGYRLGPDTSTGNRATIGGMVANNAAGSRSLRFGVMADHVEAAELVLANGEVLRFETVDIATARQKGTQHDTEGRIYRTLMHIRDYYCDEIETRFPKIPRRVSGYNLDALLDPTHINVCKVIAGSEGSLGILSEVKVRITKRPIAIGMCIVHFTDMLQGMQAIDKMLAYHPMALEMIDNKIIAMGKASPAMRNKLEWLQGDPQMVFVAEFEADHLYDVSQKLGAFSDAMRAQGIGYAHVSLLDPVKMGHVWEVRKSGLGLLLSKRTYSRAIAFLEDLTVSPQKLAPFMERFCSYLKSKGKEAGIYGHVGSGCMHIRPYIDLRQADDLKLMEQMMQDVSSMLLEFGGALSGEHGDGLIRSWLNKKMFGDKLYKAFEELKKAFDPDNRMNPGKVVNGPPLLQNLRIDPSVKGPEIKTFLDFSKEGGFALAADLCNGNGLCRKAEKTMCPSFQATHDEFHTTRARAQALRAVINGKLPLKELSSQAIFDVLDLCLECKGCKTECPSEVDMAKMKSEFLHHYHKEHGVSLRSRLFANIGKINRLNAPVARLFNWMSQTPLARIALKWVGIAPQRPLPLLAHKRFSHWFAKRRKPSGKRKQIVLMNDTFMEFNNPEVGKAAVDVLEALGFEVVVPPWKCCGRPAFSKGLLEQAKQQAEELVATLLPYAQNKTIILGIEPSCLLTVKEEFAALLGYNHEGVKTIASMCTTFDEFLCQQISNRQLPVQFKALNRTLMLHGHCHQKASVGTRPTLEVLRAIPGCTVVEIPSGCCGLAGSFGYEKEHYDLSMRIGELKLFPAIQEAPQNALIVADGFSCRCQIAHGTQRKAYHLAEILAASLK